MLLSVDRHHSRISYGACPFSLESLRKWALFLFRWRNIITKVEAIEKVMQENGGTATLQDIYNQAGRYYAHVDASKEWKAGLRGVLYREVRNGRTFVKLGAAGYGLVNYAALAA